MKLLVSFLLLSFTGLLHASEDSYLLPITRDGVTHTMITYNFWSGEYPNPVIHVQPSKNNWSTVIGYSSLRNLGKKKVCSIKTGIYHPWTKDKISLINYYSITPKINYLVQQDTILEDQKVKKGDTIKNEFYLSEGFCSYLLSDKTDIEAKCIDNSTQFKRIKFPAHPAEQWLYLSCKEGYKIFVQDTDLLSQANVNEGGISGYGEVAKK
ncbi:hypothetical protein [Candidatus Marithrix sp. Canyon 246]|uniref:hypothetical protein n=1 Tax=Candidatus Marithrix sp. Canyon 246 TaxID=1827136 RepID=UPI00084A1ED1|nr:hypothetical protein [Candidatus Marithrix sp. Canyon 246]